MKLVCGIDEVGIGTLFGAIFMCAFVCEKSLEKELEHIKVRDSKKTSKKQRKQIACDLDALVASHSDMNYFLIQKGPEEIDQKGISTCIRECVVALCCEILKMYKNNPKYTLHFVMDGKNDFGVQKILQNNPLQNCFFEFEMAIGGDNFIPQISAASILAKRAKDLEVEHFDKIYPAYKLASNSGYPVKTHIATINKLGLTPLHRKTYKIKVAER